MQPEPIPSPDDLGIYFEMILMGMSHDLAVKTVEAVRRRQAACDVAEAWAEQTEQGEQWPLRMP